MNETALEDKLVNDIYADVGTERIFAREVVEYLIRHGWVGDLGTPVDREDIRDGDRYRVEYDYVREPMIGKSPSRRRRYSIEDVATGPIQPRRGFGNDMVENEQYFLLERAQPEPPTTPGLPFKVKSKDGGTSFACPLTTDDAFVVNGQLLRRHELLERYEVLA